MPKPAMNRLAYIKRCMSKHSPESFSQRYKVMLDATYRLYEDPSALSDNGKMFLYNRLTKINTEYRNA